MRLLPLLLILVLIYSCSEEKKISGTNGTNANPGGTTAVSSDCRDKLDINVLRCFDELKKSMPTLDSNMVFEYCDCVNKELLNLYSCEEIMALKKLSEEQILSIYRPIKDKCYQLYIKGEMDKQKAKEQRDSL
jgi:hypothetical protein